MAHPVVSHDEWLRARIEFLQREKEFTRARDELSAARRELPWERVDKEYTFEGAEGTESLVDLFDGRSQLLVYHLMFSPEWDAACPHCSFWADHFDAASGAHLRAKDVSFAVI